jgi:hypothetical protein
MRLALLVCAGAFDRNWPYAPRRATLSVCHAQRM